MAGKDAANPKLALERRKNQKRKLSAANQKTEGRKSSPADKTIPTIPLVGVDCVNGIDFSSGCGVVDWYALADNPHIDFVYFRSSIGLWTDSQYEANMRGAVNIFKRPFGTYHFYISQRDTKRQVDMMVKRAAGTTLPPWWDVELTYGKTKQYLGNENEKAMKYSLEDWNYDPVIYTSPGFWDSCMPRTNWAKHHGLAVACWGRLAILPRLPRDWIINRIPETQQRRERWLFWQWWNKGRVPGINASVDLIRCPRERFVKLIG